MANRQNRAYSLYSTQEGNGMKPGKKISAEASVGEAKKSK